ncbi:MAG: hypothetical protein QY308_09160 [Ignavibacteriaceae bacterium]|nr:MAG: hypothetical protein QY308_09160 [Ignavibacteriaceae bacterium]
MDRKLACLISSGGGVSYYNNIERIGQTGQEIGMFDFIRRGRFML